MAKYEEIEIRVESNGGIYGSDSIFCGINLNDLDNYSSDRSDDAGLQCTQAFLGDVANNLTTNAHFWDPPKDLVHDSRPYASSKEIENDFTKYEESQKYCNDEEFRWLGNFYGLPDHVKKLLVEHKGINDLYEWQNECLNLPAVKKRKNLIYALPTSGGKTLVAEILILREILCRRKNVLFILPYVSIVQEKVSAMAPFALQLNFLIEEYTAGKGKCPPNFNQKRKSLFVGSIEKGAILLDSIIDAGKANELGLIVVDELHLIGERSRGAILETVLTKIMFLNANIQIIGMSATIGNLSELSDFLNADVYTKGFRPVDLKEYVKCGVDILEINPSGSALEEMFLYKRSINFKYSPEVARCDPDHIAGLVNEVAPNESCLVFCSSRKNCESVAILLTRVLPKTKFTEHRKREKLALIDALEKICGFVSPIHAKTIPYGIAYHHSGLITEERKLLETAYRFGEISVICCTSTLAAGVNFPARRVIIRAPYVGQEFITLCQYKQMTGRAGRTGMGETGESILISSRRDNVRVGEMLFSPMNNVMSSMESDNSAGMRNLILSAIGLKIAVSIKDLIRLCEKTLFYVQMQKSEQSIKNIVVRIVRHLIKDKILRVLSPSHDNSNLSEMFITQTFTEDKVGNKRNLFTLSKSSCFELSDIGNASFKAGLDYKKAQIMCHELKTAQKNLILSNFSHLLYLVVCVNSNECGDEIFPTDPALLFHSYKSLDKGTSSVFQIIGINEAQAAKIAKTMTISGPLEVQLNRLYKVLILIDVFNKMPIYSISLKYKIEPGILQQFVNQTYSATGTCIRLCEHIPEFWCFKPLFERVNSILDRNGIMELESLLQLPAVKINRAKQLYAAGFKTIEDIAKCHPRTLVHAVEHMRIKVANEIISGAKMILVKKLDDLKDETDSILRCLSCE